MCPSRNYVRILVTAGGAGSDSQAFDPAAGIGNDLIAAEGMDASRLQNVRFALFDGQS